MPVGEGVASIVTNDDLVGSSNVVEKSFESVACSSLEQTTTVVLQQTLFRLQELVLLSPTEDRQEDVGVGVCEHDVTRLHFDQPRTHCEKSLELLVQCALSSS